MSTEGSLEFGRCNAGWVARVHGRGTMQESPAFADFVGRAMDAEPETSVAFDLSDCEYLDSTFLGCLVMLQRRYTHQGECSFRLVGSDDDFQRLFAPTGLDRILPCSDDPIPDCDEWIPIPKKVLDERRLGLHVMEAHRRLAQQGGPLASAFEAIAEQFAQELMEKG